ncbi:hydroxylamine reductase [uncultured Ilyobacter sp.]|uniref:hydroxylamine reductase n=1 Tax=uncultured Ilyobacter sp. TaxID=544433 RepID=UPI002AA6514A|nr:hydroxylamine reductase [uncultured Ilyobacter sp.]
MSMFCYQCQEAASGKGCTIRGVCGKTPEEAKLQDVLLHSIKSVALYSAPLREIGDLDESVDYFILNTLFMTVTNSNFDDDVLYEQILKAVNLRDELKEICEKKNPSGIMKIFKRKTEGCCPSEKFNHLLDPISDYEDKDRIFGVLADKSGVMRTENEDERSLKEMIIYGLKGMSAYTEHAAHLGYENREIVGFIEEALLASDDPDITVDELVALTLETGKYGVEAMALLDKANTDTYGNPEITKVNIGVGKNPGILISGHDLRDMEQLLEQTKGTGVDVYTHSEMLPANYYPAFKKYDNFVGNYGGSWWHQTKEFETFNGPVLFTSNCIVPPRSGSLTYKERIFTTNAAGMGGCIHIEKDAEGKKDFTPIIEMAKKCQPPVEIETGEIVGGFAHNQVIALADKVIEAVKSGAIKKFVVMAGCDARMQDRKYYTEFAEKLPKDTVILTAGCAKYRYNKLPLGDIGGIPRVLDAGQCNDSYSLAVIAMKLQEAFGLDDINDLPIAYNIAWYEQKAVIVLLALLHLGVKNIHLGPTLPAFLSPNVTNVLVEKFGIAGISSVEEDMKIFGIEQ